MARTGKLGIADSQLGNMPPAFAGADDPSPSTGTMSGKLGAPDAMLGNFIIALNGPDGPKVVNLSLGNTLILGQSVDSGAEIMPHTPLAWAMGCPIWQLGNAQLNFTGVDAPLSDIGARSGRLGLGLGNLIPGLAGIVGVKVVNVSAENVLALIQSADSGAEIIGHASPHWALGGRDFHLGNLGLAFTGPSDPRPMTGTMTGKLGTFASLTGNMRPALGDVEGESNANVIQVTAESILQFAQSASYAAEFSRDAQSVLSLDHSVSPTTILNVVADSTLTLASEAIGTLGGIRTLTAESAIELTQAVSVETVLNLSAGSPLTLIQDATGIAGREYELNAENVLALEQDCSAAYIFDVAANSALLLSQDLALNRPWHVSAESILQETHWELLPDTLKLVEVITGLNVSAGITRPQSPSVGNVIPLTQTASVVRVKSAAIDLSAESIIELADSVDKNQVGSAATWLALSQTAAVDKCKPLESHLELASQAAALMVRKRSAASVLALTQSVTFSIVKGSIQYQYHPFIGEGAPNAPTPPPAALTGPLEGITAPFKLIYPATGGVADFVTLRAPNFGNKDRLSFNRIVRETRGGTLAVYADPIWPKIQTLVLSFSSLRSAEAQALLNFLDSHLGEEVGLLDWEHRYWRGVVTAPDDPVVQDGPDNFSASFEFEGELDPMWTP